MPANPYESPKSYGETTTALPTLRKQATRSLHALTLVLLLPAAYNYWEFDLQVVSRLPEDFARQCRSANIVGFVGGGVLAWFLGMPALEVFSDVVRMVFSRTTDRTAWQAVLYRALNRAPYFASVGAVLWGSWVFAFYERKGDFYAISWAVGIPAHLLAAFWYVPLFYQWYQLSQSHDRSS